MPASVTYLRPQSRQGQGRAEVLAPESPKVIVAFGAALMRSPPRPPGLAACVAYLQEGAGKLPSRPMALRALGNLRDALFAAPGREAEMTLLWREALATACYARLVATAVRFDAPLLTGAGLLHRTSEVTALRALAHAELEVGQRLVGPVMQEILDARDDELLARVTRCWGLPGGQRLLILRWREEQDSLRRSEGVTLLTMAQALATELVHAETCTPGLADAACESLHLPASLLCDARTATPAIEALLGCC